MSPDRGGGSDGDKDALSSWARYLKNKYGNRSAKDSPRETGGSTSTPSSSYSSSTAAASSPSSTSTSARRLSLGLPLRQANEMHSSDDDSKNLQSSLASPTQAPAQLLQVQDDVMEDTTTKFSTPRTQYLQKRKQILQIGGRGSEPCKFTWPRGVSVGPDNVIGEFLFSTCVVVSRS